MENPLTEEQIEELNSIAKLPPEEQRAKLQEFTQRLSPEQLEFLKGQQGGCVFCSIIEGKVGSKKVYEDDKFLAVLDINPGNKGQVLLFPKKHYEVLAQMEDVSELFNLANNIGKAVFEVTKARGTSMIVNSGAGARQVVPHVGVNIIPRFKDDKIGIGWEKKEISNDEMDKVAKSIRESILEKASGKKEEKIEKKKIKVIKLDDSYQRIP
ncbi:MAG: HIT family protein [Nanoarchaeota archaeon]